VVYNGNSLMSIATDYENRAGNENVAMSPLLPHGRRTYFQSHERQSVTLEFLAHSRSDIPALLSALRDLLAEMPRGGVELIAAERQRQITSEGWSPEHDDIHGSAALAKAAVCYALKSALPCFDGGHTPNMWPWADGWKPSPDPIRNLVKAGALIAAEIDRIRRLPAAPEGEKETK
jgi:hypothetical protein